jgi:hypothetical protein
MTEALTRTGARIDDPEELERLVRQIVARSDPVAIYRFGSRARGDADAGGDYDLLIVVPDDFPTGRAHTVTAFSLVEGRRIPMDVAMSRATFGHAPQASRHARIHGRSRRNRAR